MPDMKVEISETQGSKVVEEAQKPPEKKEEPKYVKYEELEAERARSNKLIENTREYYNRKFAEMKDEILSEVRPKSKESKDDLDELVQKDWKLGVEKVVENVLTRQSQANAVLTEEQRTTQLLEESKKRVMDKHKELSDPDSEKTKLFLKVLDENPDFKTNPRGPMLAAYEMENRLNSHGNIESGDKKVKEIRARASSIPSGTSPGNKGGYTMTRQDMDFCRLNNINPENYKRYKGQSEARV